VKLVRCAVFSGHKRPKGEKDLLSLVILGEAARVNGRHKVGLASGRRHPYANVFHRLSCRSHIPRQFTQIGKSLSENGVQGMTTSLSRRGPLQLGEMVRDTLHAPMGSLTNDHKIGNECWKMGLFSERPGGRHENSLSRIFLFI
jgi:hypothetical protein